MGGISGIGTSFSQIAEQLATKGAGGAATTAGDAGAGGGFGDVFKAAVQQVDELQTGADQQVGQVLSGKGTGDVGNVMASVEKADVAFQLMMQVRNKIVNAYQDIEKMQF